MAVGNSLHIAGILYFKKKTKQNPNISSQPEDFRPLLKLDGKCRASGHIFLRHNTAGYPIYFK